MASTKGVDQCAECRAMSESVPSLIRSMRGLTILGGDVSLSHVSPPQKHAAVADERWRESFLVVFNADGFHRQSGPVLEVARDLVAEEVVVGLLLFGLLLVPHRHID